MNFEELIETFNDQSWQISRKIGIKRFIFISSIKVNGETTEIGSSFSEQIDSIPHQNYGLSKYEAEQGLLEIAKNTSMEVGVIIKTTISLWTWS